MKELKDKIKKYFLKSFYSKYFCLLMILKPVTIAMKIVTKKVNFRARIIIAREDLNVIDVREMRCVYVQGV